MYLTDTPRRHRENARGSASSLGVFPIRWSGCVCVIDTPRGNSRVTTCTSLPLKPTGFSIHRRTRGSARTRGLIAVQAWGYVHRYFHLELVSTLNLFWMSPRLRETSLRNARVRTYAQPRKTPLLDKNVNALLIIVELFRKGSSTSR